MATQAPSASSEISQKTTSKSSSSNAQNKSYKNTGTTSNWPSSECVSQRTNLNYDYDYYDLMWGPPKHQDEIGAIAFLAGDDDEDDNDAEEFFVELESPESLGLTLMMRRQSLENLERMRATSEFMRDYSGLEEDIRLEKENVRQRSMSENFINHLHLEPNTNHIFKTNASLST